KGTDGARGFGAKHSVSRTRPVAKIGEPGLNALSRVQGIESPDDDLPGRVLDAQGAHGRRNRQFEFEQSLLVGSAFEANTTAVQLIAHRAQAFAFGVVRAQSARPHAGTDLQSELAPALHPKPRRFRVLLRDPHLVAAAQAVVTSRCY